MSNDVESSLSRNMDIQDSKSSCMEEEDGARKEEQEQQPMFRNHNHASVTGLVYKTNSLDFWYFPRFCKNNRTRFI